VPNTLRCAIYTRKSSEEGLDQDFNSLHAQREACEAYVLSQRHEGWRLISTLYDDGGFSGGSMERPALKALLTAIADRVVDIVVVYKVDRLTRSLTDFAKIVEVFDANSVSFVSVTQAFNTTNSMGRLTLNVLLSFAQFEREVTGERIRDKIAASKKKGMWMGGVVPFGYRAKDRSLFPEPKEAETVRHIFRRYLELGSVHALKADLDQERNTAPPGNVAAQASGGFGRSQLYRILSNPHYVGRIRHRDKSYPGLHEPIVDHDLWSAAQKQLTLNNHHHLVKANRKSASLLGGLLFDEAGCRLATSHAVKGGRRYRYYRGARKAGTSAEIMSVPAAEIEAVVIELLSKQLRDQHWLLQNIGPTSSLNERKELLTKAAIMIADLAGNDLVAKRGVILALVKAIRLASQYVELELRPIRGPGEATVIRKTLTLRRGGAKTKLVLDTNASPAAIPDPALTKALAQAHRWWRDLLAGKFSTLRELARAYETDERYVASVIRLAFLSPRLVRRILDGAQGPDLTITRMLKSGELPKSWGTQMEWAL